MQFPKLIIVQPTLTHSLSNQSIKFALGCRKVACTPSKSCKNLLSSSKPQNVVIKINFNRANERAIELQFMAGCETWEGGGHGVFIAVLKVLRQRTTFGNNQWDQIWQNPQSFWQCFKGLFTIWHNFEPTLAIFVYLWAKFHWCNGQMLKTNLAICSHW